MPRVLSDRLRAHLAHQRPAALAAIEQLLARLRDGDVDLARGLLDRDFAAGTAFAALRAPEAARPGQPSVLARPPARQETHLVAGLLRTAARACIAGNRNAWP